MDTAETLPLAYRVSWPGRIAYGIHAVAFLLIGATGLFAAITVKPVTLKLLLVGAAGFGALLFSFYGLYQVFRSSPRFLLTSESLVYRGLFLRRAIPLREIASCSHEQTTKGMLKLLVVQLRSKVLFKSRLRLDASGLKPNYLELYQQVRISVEPTPNNSLQPTSALTRRRG